MSRLTKAGILLLSFSLNFFSVQGGELSKNLVFDHLGITDGLSQSLVFDIHQDHDGYLWFATQDGLNRYDGYSFKVFRSKMNDSNSLSHNDVQDIVEDEDGNLWLGTSGGGLNKYDYKTGNFRSFRSDINDPHSLSSDRIICLYKDQSGIIWIGTDGGGLNRFDPVTDKFTRYLIPDEPRENLRSNIISSIFENSKQELWIGTERGLYKFNRSSDQFVFVNLLSDSTYTIATVITEDNYGVLWVGLDGRGIAKYNEQNNEIKMYDLHSIIKTKLPVNKIRYICPLRSGNIAIGSFGGGLLIFDPQKESCILFDEDSQNSGAISDNHIFTILEDKSQILWIGTFRGINKVDLKKRKFDHYKLDGQIEKESAKNEKNLSNFILSILKDTEKNIWCGTLGSGLFRIHTKSGEITNYSHSALNASGLRDNYIWSIYQDRLKNLWVGTGLGLHRYNPQTDKFSVLDPKTGDKTLDNLVRSIMEDQSGNLWVGFYGAGLHKYDPLTNRFDSFKHIHMKNDGRLPYLILCLFQDHAGDLWIGTEGGGLIRYNGLKNIHSQYGYFPGEINNIGSLRVNDINEDDEGNLWIGTSNGLVKLHSDRIEMDYYSEEDGLANSFIYAIEIDQARNIWVSSNRGLSKLTHPQNTAPEIRNYDVDDGLQSNEFNTHCSFNTPQGELFFGGINGFVSFFPDRIVDNLKVPTVSITEMKIGEMIQGGNPNKTSVNLAYSSNSLTLEFAALEFTNPLKNQYMYKMDGFDNEWIFSGTRRQTTYTNLDPGDYVFRVKGSNNDNIWSVKEAMVRITIIPPLWRTLWAYALYLFVVTSMLIGYIKWRVKKLETAKRELEQKVDEKTIELKMSYEKLRESQAEIQQTTKMKAIGTMASGMAHSFNNLLMVILGSSQLLKEKLGNQDASKQVLQIEQAANEGAEIIKKLQDFGKSDERGTPELINLNELIADIVEISKFRWSDQKRLEGKSLDILEDYGKIPLINGYASDLRLVFIDIILNAIEAYTSAGIIRITTRAQPESVVVTVSDQGVGMEKETVDHIFDPFYSTRESSNGLGLSQVYSIINHHGGTITVDSNPGQGTEVTIKLPAGPLPVFVDTPEKERALKTETKKIFIVEDEPLIRELYTDMLAMKGHQVVSYASGEEALANWDSGSFKIIICDLGLPGMNGWELISRIRKTEHTIPIIVLTGWGNEIEDERALELNVQKVLAKPVSIELLVGTIEELCQ
jgi:ligand-binding sensor domain-containing protein/signal transduction histidine kinase